MKRLFILLLLFAMPAIAGPALAGTASNPVPFGMWRVPLDKMPSYDTTVLAFEPTGSYKATLTQVLAQLELARTAKKHVFMSLVDFAKPGSGAGDYAYWCKTAPCTDFDSYVQDGTLLAIHILEYDHVPGKPANPSLADIQSVGHTVKSLWPNVPVAVDTVQSSDFIGTDWTGSIDILLLSFYTGDRTDYQAGDPVMMKEATDALQAKLRYTMGTNPFGGLSSRPTPAEVNSFAHYTEYALLNLPQPEAVLVWRWWADNSSHVSNGKHNHVPNFWWKRNRGVTAVLKEIEACAAAPSQAACPRALGTSP